MRYAGETACATKGKSFACIGGTGFSLSTPACGRIFSHLLTVGVLIGDAVTSIGAPSVSERVALRSRVRPTISASTPLPRFHGPQHGGGFGRPENPGAAQSPRASIHIEVAIQFRPFRPGILGCTKMLLHIS